MKRIMRLLTAAVLSAMLMISVSAVVFADERLPLVNDYAGILTENEAAELETRLEQLSDAHNVDILIVTDGDDSVTDGLSIADDFFDYNGYGRGNERSGVVLYVNPVADKRAISTRGFGITAYTDYGIDNLVDQILDDIQGGYYNTAFNTYADIADQYFTMAENGEPYDVGNVPKGSFPFLKNLIIALIVGLIGAFIYTSILKGELKSVAPSDSAADYEVPNSMKVTGRREMFLYRNVTRTAKPKKESGGSSTHTSSSGASHGGRSF